MSKIEFTTSLHADKSTTTVTMPREISGEIVPILAVIIKSLNNSLARTLDAADLFENDPDDMSGCHYCDELYVDGTGKYQHGYGFCSVGCADQWQWRI